MFPVNRVFVVLSLALGFAKVLTDRRAPLIDSSGSPGPHPDLYFVRQFL